MEEKLDITFIYTEDEYVAAARLYYARFYHSRFNLFFGVLLLLFGLGGIMMFGTTFFSTLSAVAGSLLLALGCYVHFAAPGQQYHSNPLFRERYFLSFAEAGLLFRTKNSESKIEWSFYNKVWETKQFYFLRYGDNAFSLIPKRAFTDAKQEAIFRELLRRKIDPQFETQNISTPLTKSLDEYVSTSSEPPDWR